MWYSWPRLPNLRTHVSCGNIVTVALLTFWMLDTCIHPLGEIGFFTEWKISIPAYIPYSGYFSRGGVIFAVFAVSHRPRTFNPRIIHIHVLVLMLFVWVRDSTCCQFLQWNMALLQSVPREQLPNPEGSLSVVVPPAAIRAAINCVRQTDKGAKMNGTPNIRARNEPSLIGKYASDNGVVAAARSVFVSFPGQVFSFAKRLIFRRTTVARKLNPLIVTVIQPKRPLRKFSPAKNTRYTVCDLFTGKNLHH